MQLNKIKNENCYTKDITKINKKEAKNLIQELESCKKFALNASSVYYEYARKSNFIPYIQDTKMNMEKTEKCFNNLINDIEIRKEEIINDKQILQEEIKKLQQQIEDVAKVKEFIAKSSLVYAQYIFSSGIMPYYEKIKQDSDFVINHLDLFIELYQNKKEKILSMLSAFENNPQTLKK